MKIMNIAIFIFLCTLVSGAKINVNGKFPIILDKGTKSNISFTLDEPIICELQFVDCNVVILLTNTLPNKIFLSTCLIKWESKQWFIPQNLTIGAVDNFINDDSVSTTITVNPAISYSEYYNNFKANDIAIQTKVLPTSSCSGTGDPHYTTLDGAYYNIYLAGQYILYKTKNRNFELQVITQGYPSQHCGFAVREDNDLVVIHGCTGNKIYKRFCGTTQCQYAIGGISYPTVSISGGSSNSYIVKFRSGTIVEMHFYNNIYGNMYITVPGQDYNSVSGICGNFNGVRSDDIPAYIISNSNQIPSSFIPTYDLFNWRPTGFIDINYNPNSISCNYTSPIIKSPILLYGDSVDITKLIYGISNNNNIIFTPTIFVTDNNTTPVNTINMSTVEISYSSAYQECNNSFYLSKSVIACINNVYINVTSYILNCAEDVFYSGDSSFINVTLSGFVNDCLGIASRNISTWHNSTTPNLAIQSSVCVNQCNNNGNCSMSVCNCYTNYTGNDCSINTNIPPMIISSNITNCSNYCNKNMTLIYGNNFWNTDNIKCNFNFTTNQNIITNGYYIESNNIVCDIPNIHVYGINIVSASIGIDYDGKTSATYNNNLININWYDKNCYNSNFEQLNNICIINNLCYSNNTVNPTNPCMSCNSDNNKLNWIFNYGNNILCYPTSNNFQSIIKLNNVPKNIIIYQVNAVNHYVESDVLQSTKYNLTPNKYFNINENDGSISSIEDIINQQFNLTLTVEAIDRYNNINKMNLTIMINGTYLNSVNINYTLNTLDSYIKLVSVPLVSQNNIVVIYSDSSNGYFTLIDNSIYLTTTNVIYGNYNVIVNEIDQNNNNYYSLINIVLLNGYTTTTTLTVPTTISQIVTTTKPITTTISTINNYIFTTTITTTTVSTTIFENKILTTLTTTKPYISRTTTPIYTVTLPIINYSTTPYVFNHQSELSSISSSSSQTIALAVVISIIGSLILLVVIIYYRKTKKSKKSTNFTSINDVVNDGLNNPLYDYVSGINDDAEITILKSSTMPIWHLYNKRDKEIIADIFSNIDGNYYIDGIDNKLYFNLNEIVSEYNTEKIYDNYKIKNYSII